MSDCQGCAALQAELAAERKFKAIKELADFELDRKLAYEKEQRREAVEGWLVERNRLVNAEAEREVLREQLRIAREALAKIGGAGLSYGADLRKIALSAHERTKRYGDFAELEPHD